MQQAAYDAQLAAGLPTSDLARAILVMDGGAIGHRSCATYIYGIQQAAWFKVAFAMHAGPVTVVGGRGRSHADTASRQVKIGMNDRLDLSKCEQACLHELAHIVTAECEPTGALREPVEGRGSSKGHHHAWRANFVYIVKMTLGKQAALRLRHEFNQWGLPTGI